MADPTSVGADGELPNRELSLGEEPYSSSGPEFQGVLCSNDKDFVQGSSPLVTADAKSVVLCSQVLEKVTTAGLDHPVEVAIVGQGSPEIAHALPSPVEEVDASPVSGPLKETPAVTEATEKLQAPAKQDPTNDWCAHAKGYGKRLSKKGEAFTLPSGEACIKIPNSVIEKNRKAWDSFVLGQFYSDPPSQGTLHNIVNGIWSRQYRDISVSKMEGFAYLFRIPNAATRARVIKQCLWQIEGQTMFVAKWEPGVIPAKPELTSAPIWLELRQVPFQFFNEDGLERIAGLVGDPKFLHPATANKTNLEVAKVFTIIDPRKPLPEAVNVQFDSGEISRVMVF